MENIYTNTTATFTTINGQTVSYREVLDAVKKSVEVYSRYGGRDMDVADLEDLFQETVIKALRYCSSFDPSRAKIQTWVSRIARNCQRDSFKDLIRHKVTFAPLVSLSSDGEEYIDSDIEFSVKGYDADGEVETSEAMERIMNALNSLSENQQFIISLHLDGLKPKKMAELIGCSAVAAATLLCRARKALKRALGSSFLSEYGIAS